MSELWPFFALPPPTIDTDRWVTVSDPPASRLLVSVRVDGRVTRRLREGPCETAVLKPDRLVYAPAGATGTAFLLPYAPAVPNAVKE